MAAAQNLHSPRPLPRSESLQKMLDLERQFKIARMQAQTPPKPNWAAVPHPPTRPVPLQTRRRDSSSSLALQVPLPTSSIPTSTRRAGPVSPLSITVPSPTASSDKGKRRDMAAVQDVAPMPKASAETTQPSSLTDESRVKTDDDDDDDDDARSDQSSICQSPSWEGYGQKKKEKKKKQEAEHRKRETDKMDQELRASAKKRMEKSAKTKTAKPPNRLFKSPPQKLDAASHRDRDRPPSAGSAPHESSAPSKPGRDTPSGNRSLIPQVWGIAVGTGRGGSKSRPLHSRSTSAQGTATTATDNAADKSKDKTGPAPTAEKTYPPLSSRSHALRHSLLPVQAAHTRQHSASASASSVLEDPSSSSSSSSTPKDHYKMYTAKNRSDQSIDYSAEPMVRGRQSADPAASGSYVGKARAQSIERSIKGLMQDAALSDPNLLNAPNRMAFSYLSPHGPETSSINSANSINSNSANSVSARSDGGVSAGHSDVPPSPGLATPSSGILSSIKSRISRRSSISSGSTSHTGKSFKERAMGAMHMQHMQPAGAIKATAPSPLPSQEPSPTPAAATVPLPTPATAVEDIPSQQQALHSTHRDTRQLPKPARVLGEVNHETMSQGASSHNRPSEGSSASSCHDDSSVPPSPASTPDTSRPQSAKCVSAAAVDNNRHSSAETLGANDDQRNQNPLSEGLGILDEAWSQSTVAPDIDAQSFVTTLTNQKSAGSLRSQGGILNLKEAALLASHDTLGTHPALRAAQDPLIEARAPDARRSAPMVSSPLANVARSVRALPRPQPQTQTQTQQQQQQKPPLAKMLVECCQCKFFHDMPSRVYECMAQPDAVVTDRALGVSGAITTMVKCPWCAHNMSTQCCAGYAAVVYLKERLH